MRPRRAVGQRRTSMVFRPCTSRAAHGCLSESACMARDRRTPEFVWFRHQCTLRAGTINPRCALGAVLIRYPLAPEIRSLLRVMDYQFDLPTFRGPLDLLLFLVKRNEVDVCDIPI